MSIENFYIELETTINKMQKKELIFILGDLNFKIVSSANQFADAPIDLDSYSLMRYILQLGTTW